MTIWLAAKDAGPTLGGAAERNLSECFHGGHSHSQTSQRACGQTSKVIPPPSTPVVGSHASYVSPCVPASSLMKLAEELVSIVKQHVSIMPVTKEALSKMACYPKPGARHKRPE